MIGAGEAADAARQADGLFALLLELQKNVHGALLDVALDLGVLRLHRLEIIQLIQAQKAQLPQVVAEHVAFVEQEFAADDFVARAGVAGEIDAPDEELFLLVEGECQIDGLGVVVHFRVRHGGKIDEAEISVQLGVVLDGLADFGHAEDLALLDGENGFEIGNLEKEAFIGIRVAHVERAHAVPLAFLDGNRDVGGPALVDSHQGNARPASMPCFSVTFWMIGSFTSTLK